MEARILAAAVKSRKAFDDLLEADIDSDLSDLGEIIWKEIREFYGNDPTASQADLAVINSVMERKYPKHAERIKLFLEKGEDVSVTNVVKEVFEVKLDSLRHKMSQALVAGKDDEYLKLRENFDTLKRGELSAEDKGSEIIINKSVKDILEVNSPGNKIRLLPKVLNDATDGGVIRGTHIVVFAPTEMGKSLFNLNMAFGFLKQGLKVMYGCNEDPADMMLQRALYRLSGMTRQEIEKDVDEAERRAIANGYERLIYVDLQPGTEAELKSLIEEYAPDVLIVDQIRNLDMKESNKVLALERSATMMRNFGKYYHLIPVSITQAADSATGKVMLTRGDIDFSNVGIPGTSDLMIGIGADTEMEIRGQRMLSLVKNKVSGNHEPLRVLFDNKLTKVT